MKKKVVIVDDDSIILESLQEALEDHGYDVATYSMFPGIQTLDTEGLPNVILLDFRLPGQNGGEIARHLKSIPDTQWIPIIMVSASAGARTAAKHSGVDDFVAKPFDLDDIIRRIDKCIENT